MTRPEIPGMSMSKLLSSLSCLIAGVLQTQPLMDRAGG